MADDDNSNTYDGDGASLLNLYNAEYRELVDDTSLAGNTIKRRLRVYLAPKPGSDRSIRFHFQRGSQQMYADASRSGAPGIVERCAILETVVKALRQEGSPAANEFKVDLKEEVLLLRQESGKFKRRPKRIKYIPEDEYY
jgi:hypothetical protein